MRTTVRKSSISARFSAAADTYDDAADVQKTVGRWLIAFVDDISAPATVLEIGCGTGLFTRMIADRFPVARIEAVDIADSLIQVAQKRFADDDRVRFHVADATELRTGGQYPLVVSNSSLQWMQPLQSVLAGIKGVLKRGGRFVFSMMINGTLAELHEARARVAPHKRAREALPEGDAVTAAVTAAGLAIVAEDRRMLRADYASGREFLNAMHGLGVTGGPFSASELPLGKGEIARLISDYNDRYMNRTGGVYATYEVLCISAQVA